MTQAEQDLISQYVRQCSDVFQQMVQKVSRQLMLGDDAHTDASPFGGLNPGRINIDGKDFLRKQFAFFEQQQTLWQNASRSMMGDSFPDIIKESADDKRFRDPDWRDNPAFHYVKQAYLLNAQYLQELVSAFEFEDDKLKDQIQFYTRQLVSSMAPTNYVFTNPEVCREILRTEGECLARGVDKFFRDLENSPAEAFRISQVNTDAFVLGENLAATHGKVVFRNELIELLQYCPRTASTLSTPLLIVPPFINKFYILDLGEKKSLVQWLVDSGFTVFLVSWINPTKRHHSLGFDDYIVHGLVPALDAVGDITGGDLVNAVGYCVGGTLLTMAKAYLTALGDSRLHSITLLTTLLDYAEPGEVGTYLNPCVLPYIEQSVKRNGFLDGRILGVSFSLLRENNLFWSFFVENYLKGKDPLPFDILYWNSDSTNLPEKAFLEYLNKLYIGNQLTKTNQYQINNVRIDLTAIPGDTYCLAAESDHLVLWRSAYRSASLLRNARVRFVLTESGHVAGVVNPVARNKYGYWHGNFVAYEAEHWRNSAQKEQQSWWSDWLSWLQPLSGEWQTAPPMGSQQFPALMDAPGEYVLRRLDEYQKTTTVNESVAEVSL